MLELKIKQEQGNKKITVKLGVILYLQYLYYVLLNSISLLLLFKKSCWSPDQCDSVGCHPAKGRVTGLISSQGTCLGCRFSP